jgi:hypothetical protein
MVAVIGESKAWTPGKSPIALYTIESPIREAVGITVGLRVSFPEVTPGKKGLK